jgi:hypothetical protein
MRRFWGTAICALSDFARGWCYSKFDEEGGKQVWSTIRKGFPRIISLSWKLRSQLCLLDPNDKTSMEIRASIVSLMWIMVEVIKSHKDIIL